MLYLLYSKRLCAFADPLFPHSLVSSRLFGMHHQSRPAVQQAIDYIVSSIASGAFARGDRLPSMKRLASLAGVSLVTMWKAVNTLKDRGVLDCMRGRPTRVGERGRSVPPLSAEQTGEKGRAKEVSPVVRRVLSAVEDSIVQGRYLPGNRLPSYKELQSELGVSYRPLKKALTELQRKGVIVAWKRGYAVPGHARRSTPRSRIVFLAARQVGETMRLDLGGGLLLHLLEQECAKGGMVLDRIMYFAKGPRLVFVDIPTGSEYDELRDRPEVIGYIVMAVNRESSHNRVMEWLSLMKKPVALLSNLRRSHLPLPRKNQRVFRYFVTGTTATPGREVGEFLLNRGHRKVAFFSAFPTLDWSKKRLGGVREALRDAGISDGIVEFALDNTTYPPSSTDMSRESRHVVAGLEQALRNIEKGLPRAMIRPLQRQMEDFFTSGWITIDNALRLEPLFDRAMEHDDIRVWVCAHDPVAVCARDYLQSRGIPVPGRISLIAFDNTYDAANRLITSYDFNMTGLAHALMGYLLRSGYFAVPRAGSVTEVRGMIVERMTTSGEPAGPGQNLLASGARR